MVDVEKLRFSKNGNQALLSPLESDVLDILWKKGDMKVKDIHLILRKKRKVALTSIAVILDRLFQKKIVSRKAETGRGGVHYIYKATPVSDFQESIVEKTVDKLINSYGNVAVNYFNERFGKKRK